MIYLFLRYPIVHKPFKDLSHRLRFLLVKNKVLVLVQRIPQLYPSACKLTLCLVACFGPLKAFLFYLHFLFAHGREKAESKALAIRNSTANQEELISVVWKAFAETMNTAFDDSIFSDVLDMMQGSRTFVDILANKAVDTFFGAFVPNLFWTFLNYMTPVKPTYSGGLMGYIERGLVKTLPPIAWALPKRRDPYTGQLQYKYNMPWADGGARPYLRHPAPADRSWTAQTDGWKGHGSYSCGQRLPA